MLRFLLQGCPCLFIEKEKRMAILNDNHMAFRKMVRELAVKEIAPKAALFDHEQGFCIRQREGGYD